MLTTPMLRRLALFFLVSAALLAANVHADEQAIPNNEMGKLDLGKKLEVGDVVFIRIPFSPFTEVSKTTVSWTNHVGIVVEVSGKEPLIAESRFPLSGQTSWSKFVKRSDKGRVAITRLPTPLNATQQAKLKLAVARRKGMAYDTGFNLHSHKQFCSRYVREVLQEAAHVELGKVENFATLLKNNPQANQKFWRSWFFGSIPWERETVTPASLLRDDKMEKVFDGRVI
ncbi:MAG: YebB family permuted papain-like enzyme [Gallionella sp.]